MQDAPDAPPPVSERRRADRAPVGGIILVIVGVVLLLQTTGIISWDVWSNLWQFWPVLIIAGGIGLLFGSRAPWLAGLLVAALLIVAIVAAVAFSPSREQVVTSLTEPLGSLSTVDVRIDFGAGEMTVQSLPADSPNVVQGQFETPGGAANASLRRSGDSGELQIRMDGPRFGSIGRAKWDVSLARTPRLSINLDGGAAQLKLDLRDLQVRELTVDAGAANIEITLPANAGETKASIDAGAANVEIVVPQGVAARINSSGGLSSFNVDMARFPRSNGSYVSPDFNSATNKVTIDLSVGASSVSVK